jgi:hypothetical protein
LELGITEPEFPESGSEFPELELENSGVGVGIFGVRVRDSGVRVGIFGVIVRICGAGVSDSESEFPELELLDFKVEE